MPAYGVMFHHFYNDRHPRGQGAISAEEFADLIRHVGRPKILSAHEWLRRALEGSLGEQDVCLTFDDALLCQYEIAAPVLQELGLTAFWFIYSSVFEGNVEPLEVYRYFRTTAFTSVDEFYDRFADAVRDVYPVEFERAVGTFDPKRYLAEFPFYTDGDRTFRYLRDDVLGPARYHQVMGRLMAGEGFDSKAIAGSLWMTDEHLRYLRDAGNVIGLHSYSHPTRMREMPGAVQTDEYGRNFSHLRRVLGEAPICMSHPCNSYNGETFDVLRKLGIKVGFRANMEAVANRSAFEFLRQDHANVMREMRA